jgi:hypothetical protein
MRSVGTRSILGILGAALIAGGLVLAADEPKPIERFDAFAASLGTGRSNVVEILINRWSTDEERDRLLTTLQEFGQDRLLSELQKIRPPVGHISTRQRLGWDLFYARNHPNPDGSRRVVFATNRRVAFGEAANNTRSMQYQFTLGELHLDANGKGDGKLVPMARVSWNKDQHKLEIENYNALPVDLLSVTAKKP